MVTPCRKYFWAEKKTIMIGRIVIVAPVISTLTWLKNSPWKSANATGSVCSSGELMKMSGPKRSFHESRKVKMPARGLWFRDRLPVYRSRGGYD